MQPAWSPDSRRLVYHSSLRHGIWVTSIEGGAARQVAAFGSRPAWSPDGSTIAFQSDEFLNEFGQPGSQLWVVPAGGGEPRALTRPGAHAGRARNAAVVAGRRARLLRGDPQRALRAVVGARRRRAPDPPDDRQERGNRRQTAGAVGGWTRGNRGPGVERGAGEDDIIEVPIGDQGGAAQVRPVRTPPGRGVRSISMAVGGALAAVVQVEMDGALVLMPVTTAGAAGGVARTVARGIRPAVSPDGTRIAYDRDGEVRVVNLDGTGECTAAC